MSSTPDDPHGRADLPPQPAAAAEPGVPAHDATLFDDPGAPLLPPVSRAASAPAAPFVPAAPAAPAGLSAPPAPPAAAAPAARPDPWLRTEPDDAGLDHLTPPRPAQPVTGFGDKDAAAAPLPAPVDTGRLFRSAGAEGDTAAEAIPAMPSTALPATGIPAEQPRGPSAAAAAAALAAGAAAHAAAGHPIAPANPAAWVPTPSADAPGPWTTTPPTGTPTPTAWTPVPPAAGAGVGSRPLAPASTPSPFAPEAAGAPGDVQADLARTAGDPARPRGGTGLTWTGVTVVVVGVTVLMALADVLVTHGIGVITGVGLVLSTLYAALAVRPADLWAAVVTPPLAYLVALLTAGQFTLPSGGSLLVREGFMVFTGLALNAPWIIGATLVALVIVLVRRARSRRDGTLPTKASKVDEKTDAARS